MKDPNDEIRVLKDIRINLNPITKNNTIIKVDITVEAKKTLYSHLGCLSTEFMKTWLNLYPQLNPIVLTLKYLLSKKSLNKPYKGGISSYCLLIMAAAYIK
jgi:DNA polymerase sigma